jgi:tRNA G10  N-methylase Trm11
MHQKKLLPAQRYMPAQHPETIKYWFVLGREPLLAAAELGAVLSLGGYRYEPPILRAGIIEIDCKKIIQALGGTVKIGMELADNIEIKEIKEVMIGELKKVEGKIHFGISLYAPESDKKYGLNFVKKLGLEIKKSLKEQDFSVRYVENKEPMLSSVTVEKNGLTQRGREFLIRPDNSGMFSLASTCAVQPFEQLSNRDYGRPGRDDVSGMLPPKLAMMMINLSGAPKKGLLFDPFCGSGTIITEAMLLGYKNLAGADISGKAVADTLINIEWIKEKLMAGDSSFSYKIFKSDIGKIADEIKNNSVDAIITEPFLGRPLHGNESKNELALQGHELKKLYLRAFEQFAKILKLDGVAVVIIPRFRFKQETVSLNCIEEIKNLGFEPQALFENNYSLTSARPEQRIVREIWKFRRRGREAT